MIEEDYQETPEVISEQTHPIEKTDVEEGNSSEGQSDNENNLLAEIFRKQLADIQAQIASLEKNVPSNLQNQLLAVHKQLSNILEHQNNSTQKSSEVSNKYIQKSYKLLLKK